MTSAHSHACNTRLVTRLFAAIKVPTQPRRPLFRYPVIIIELLERCQEFRSRTVPLDALKASVWDAAQSVVSIEDRELRKFLQQAEAKLDMVEHTADTGKVFDSVTEVVADLEIELRRHL